MSKCVEIETVGGTKVKLWFGLLLRYGGEEVIISYVHTAVNGNS